MITIRIWILYTPYYHCTIIIYYYVLIYTIRIWLLLGTIRIWILYTPYYYCPIIIFYYLLRYTIRIWLFYKLIYTRSKVILYYFLLFDGSLDDQDPWTSTSPTTPWSSRWFWRCSPRWRRPPASAPPRWRWSCHRRRRGDAWGAPENAGKNGETNQLGMEKPMKNTWKIWRHIEKPRKIRRN